MFSLSISSITRNTFHRKQTYIYIYKTYFFFFSSNKLIHDCKIHPRPLKKCNWFIEYWFEEKKYSKSYENNCMTLLRQVSETWDNFFLKPVVFPKTFQASFTDCILSTITKSIKLKIETLIQKVYSKHYLTIKKFKL